MDTFKVFISIVLLSLLGKTTDAVCGVCSMTNFAACINATAFRICYDGINPSSDIEVCQENTVCTDARGVCKPNTKDVEVACVLSPVTDLCYQCNGPFACVSQTQFAYCNEDGSYGHVATCSDGQICSVNELLTASAICANRNSTLPTCQNAATEPEAPPVVGDVGDCKDIVLRQTFQITTEISRAGHTCSTDQGKGC